MGFCKLGFELLWLESFTRKLYWRFHNSFEVVKMFFKMENQFDFVSRKKNKENLCLNSLFSKNFLGLWGAI